MSYIILIINNKYKTNQFNIKVRTMFLQGFFHKKDRIGKETRPFIYL